MRAGSLLAYSACTRDRHLSSASHSEGAEETKKGKSLNQHALQLGPLGSNAINRKAPVIRRLFVCTEQIALRCTPEPLLEVWGTQEHLLEGEPVSGSQGSNLVGNAQGCDLAEYSGQFTRFHVGDGQRGAVAQSAELSRQ